jgi:hypothetical protein
VLRSLAERLHQHHIGAVVFKHGVAPVEVLDALRLLARERERTGQPLGLGEPSELEVGPHVRLYPLTFERLELADQEPEKEPEADSGRGTRVASLWIGLARAALATDEEEVEPARTEPGAVAAAINEHPAAQAYDQVIVGYLLQIANELKSSGGSASAAVRRRMSRLVRGLNDSTLQRLIEMGGDQDQRRRFLLDAAEGLAAEAVVDLVRVASEASHQTVSDSMLRILRKLSVQAETGSRLQQGLADAALRDQIRALITDWTLEDPNPEAYTEALQGMASHRRATFSAGVEKHPPEPFRVLQMALELGTMGPAVEAASQTLIDAGRLPELIGALDTVERSDASAGLWRLLGKPEHILATLSREPVNFPLLDRVLARADPVKTARAMLDALEDEDSHIAHSTLVRALGRLGPEVAHEAGGRLNDPRPRVKRSLLSLLNELEVVPTGVSPLSHARHAEAQVRREALQLALRVPAERDRAIGLALTDTDERVVRVGVRAVQSGVPETAVALIAQRAGDVRLPMDLRVNVIRALGSVRSNLALEALLRVTSSGRTFLRRPRLAVRSPEMVAGISVLAERWAGDRKAAAVLKRARSSGDPDVRAAAGTGA